MAWPNVESRVGGVDEDGNIFTIKHEENYRWFLAKYRPDGTQVGINNNIFDYKITDPNSQNPLITVAKDKAANLYVSQANVTYSINSGKALGGRILKITPTGQASVLFESSTISPTGIVIDDNENILTIDLATNDLYTLKSSGEFEKIANLGVVTVGQWIWNRNIWLARTNNGTIYSGIDSYNVNDAVMVTPDKKVTNIKNGRAILGLGSHKGSAYLLESDVGYNQVIRKIDSNGSQSIFAGTLGANGPQQQARCLGSYPMFHG